MKKTFINLTILLIVICVSVGLFLQHRRSMKSRLVINRTQDGKGVFVGEKGLVSNENNSTNLSPETRERVQKHQKDIRAVDVAWEKKAAGDDHFKSGEYELAVQAYLVAYQQNTFSKTMIGYKLIESYEKLYRYDDALAILDDMVDKKWSPQGLEKADKIRTRLLAEKNAAVPSSNNG